MKRPEIPDERYGRCEVCAKAGRVAYRFRLGPSREAPGIAVKAGELSPRALRQRWREPLKGFAGQPATKSQLGLHEVELVTTRDRLDAIRLSPDLAGRPQDALAALRAAAERTEGAW